MRLLMKKSNIRKNKLLLLLLLLQLQEKPPKVHQVELLK